MNDFSLIFFFSQILQCAKGRSNASKGKEAGPCYLKTSSQLPKFDPLSGLFKTAPRCFLSSPILILLQFKLDLNTVHCVTCLYCYLPAVTAEYINLITVSEKVLYSSEKS